MKWLLDFMGMTLGGALGWWLGAKVSIFTAFVVSTVGTGVGLYYTRKLSRSLLP